jgi:hypothetical protein
MLRENVAAFVHRLGAFTQGTQGYNTQEAQGVGGEAALVLGFGKEVSAQCCAGAVSLGPGDSRGQQSVWTGEHTYRGRGGGEATW